MFYKKVNAKKLPTKQNDELLWGVIKIILMLCIGFYVSHTDNDDILQQYIKDNSTAEPVIKRIVVTLIILYLVYHISDLAYRSKKKKK